MAIGDAADADEPRGGERRGAAEAQRGEGEGEEGGELQEELSQGERDEAVMKRGASEEGREEGREERLMINEISNNKLYTMLL